MVDLIALVGTLLMIAGAVVIYQAMSGMQKTVNAGRSPDQQIRGFFLLPTVSGPVRKAMRAEHPDSLLLKRPAFGAALIVAGLVIITATNSFNAHHQ